MDVLPRITRQLFDQFREMSPVQRALSVAVLFVTLCGFCWLLILGNGSEFQPVSFGKVFDNEEMISAERALVSAGLTAFRHDGKRLMAPRKDLDRYNAALLEFDAMPADLGSQMLKQYETLGPFSTDRQRQQMKEALLLQELRRMIKAVPDIEDARVAIALPERKTGWNQKTRATANVSVKPRNGREVSAMLVNSLRHVVASMVPDLQPADVTIFDVTRGQAYTGETQDDPTASRDLQSSREMARQYESQIQKALSHIPNVGVTVHIDIDSSKTPVARHEIKSQRVEHSRVASSAEVSEDWDSPTEDSHVTSFRGPGEKSTEALEPNLATATPKAVQVSISIPRDYIRGIAKRRDAKRDDSADHTNSEFIEEEVLMKVERIVGRLIPADSADERDCRHLR